MKRTCETCKHSCPAYLDGTLKCFRYPSGAPRDAGTEACKHYELAPTALKFAAEASLEKARAKHPEFVAIPCSKRAHAIATAAGNMAKQIKADLERESTAQCYVDCQLEMVLKSEVYEFLEAFHNGDFNAAMQEAGDVIAVLYRALNGEGRRA